MARKMILTQTSRAFSLTRSLYYKRIVFFIGIKEKLNKVRGIGLGAKGFGNQVIQARLNDLVH